ncbi:S8 family peptidase [Pseudomonas fluorescens]|uniref:S8 family peptidase n=1 Tax=Pseudomonas fluorescens TaxID=294 RepID=UPI0019081DA6|nr:S8 family peptidase [Pseudomonas fluorescens]MBD8091475.1 S8 family peptidase [Pseudomonas fluorescens]MBD8716907.1 S8 family peptidase [Pseudomonas fluorescens]
MVERNILLGKGEALATAREIKRNSGPKKYPYTLEEVKEAISSSIDQVQKSIAALPPGAKPRGEGVFELTLHPAFLARTYFPKSILEKSGLRDVGSKESSIIPRQVTNAGESGKLQATATIFIAGNESSVANLRSILNASTHSKQIEKELKEIESIRWIENTDKIRGPLPKDEKTHSFEVALHAGADEEDIVASFSEFVKIYGAKADLSRRIKVGGLTFVPVYATSAAIIEVAKHSFLRVARPMPELRIAHPTMIRSPLSNYTASLPFESAHSPEKFAAVFDGGLGSTDLDLWATEYYYEDTDKTNGNLLMHGNEVTSTFLFGRLQSEGDKLKRPFMNVHHYRVLSPVSGQDPDLFDVLLKIKHALDSGDYKFVNLSLGPRMPINDEEVHAWTATLDQICSRHGILATVAVGNDGDIEGASRIQPPGDMVNALAVGSADISTENWKRASYSCIGPGRSPGYVKPDGVAFGGSDTESFKVYNPMLGSSVGVQGTSYAAPLTLRTAAGVACSTSYEMTAIALKALLVHHADTDSSISRDEIGWGRFKEDPFALLECEEGVATIIFQGKLEKGQYLRCPIPFPDIPVTSKAQIKATFCIQAHTDPEHAINYTRSGMGVVFRPKSGANIETSKDFFGRKSQYKMTEREFRDDAHKWETCLHRTRNFKGEDSLVGPVFDIEYHARESSRGVTPSSAPDVNYALIVSVKAEDIPDIYNLIRQKYKVLQPVEINVETTIST